MPNKYFVNLMDFLETHHKTIGYACGSCLGTIVSSPIETIKVNYQTSDKSIINITKDIIKNHGFSKPIYATLINRFASSGCKYYCYNEIKKFRQTNNNNLPNNMLNGFLSGIIIAPIMQPFDAITNHLQRQHKLNQMKVRSLYTGFSQTIARNILLYTLFFPLFDFWKHQTNNIVISCVITSGIITFIMHPIEYIRTNKMAKRAYNIRECYKGFLLGYTHNALHMCISMVVMHTFSLYFAK